MRRLCYGDAGGIEVPRPAQHRRADQRRGSVPLRRTGEPGLLPPADAFVVALGTFNTITK
jgi:hypothetical protein